MVVQTIGPLHASKTLHRPLLQPHVSNTFLDTLLSSFITKNTTLLLKNLHMDIEPKGPMSDRQRYRCKKSDTRGK
jgi:hypothetical protein